MVQAPSALNGRRDQANAGLFEELEGQRNAGFHNLALRMVEALRNEHRAA